MALKENKKMAIIKMALIIRMDAAQAESGGDEKRQRKWGNKKKSPEWSSFKKMGGDLLFHKQVQYHRRCEA